MTGHEKILVKMFLDDEAGWWSRVRVRRAFPTMLRDSIQVYMPRLERFGFTERRRNPDLPIGENIVMLPAGGEAACEWQWRLTRAGKEEAAAVLAGVAPVTRRTYVRKARERGPRDR